MNEAIPPSIRSGRVMRRFKRHVVLFEREVALRSDLHIFATPGYRVYACNLATLVETELGFVSDAGGTISGASLADGDYEIRIRAEGYYWRDARYQTRHTVKIESGAIVTPIPAVEGLTYERANAKLYLQWSCSVSLPEDFAIWVSASNPVVTTGTPDYTVTATTLGGYQLEITDDAAIQYVAMCARSSPRRGPEATLTIPAPVPSIASPLNQRAHYE
jgi:hypothetical protein